MNLAKCGTNHSDILWKPPHVTVNYNRQSNCQGQTGHRHKSTFTRFTSLRPQGPNATTSIEPGCQSRRQPPQAHASGADVTMTGRLWHTRDQTLAHHNEQQMCFACLHGGDGRTPQATPPTSPPTHTPWKTSSRPWSHELSASTLGPKAANSDVLLIHELVLVILSHQAQGSQVGI